MYCKVCGKELADSAIFCGNCGTKVEREAVEEVVTATEEVAEEVATAAEEKIENLAATAEDIVEEKTTAIEDAIEEKIDAVKEALEENTAVAEEAVKETMSATVENVAEATSVLQEAAETVVAETPVAEPAPVVTPTPVVVPTPPLSVPQIDKAAVKAEAKAAKEALKAAKAEAKAERKRYMVKRNRVMSTIFCVFLSVITTAVMFATVGVGVLSISDFDEFYEQWKFTNFGIIMSFWSLWLLEAILVLLILLIFVSIRRRKYAIFNYVGIPMMVNGAIFALVALLNKWIVKTFDLSELFEELFDVIGDEAKNTVLFAGVIMLAAGALLVLIYVLVSVIHKAAYRKKCVKAECNQ